MHTKHCKHLQEQKLMVFSTAVPLYLLNDTIRKVNFSRIWCMKIVYRVLYPHSHEASHLYPDFLVEEGDELAVSSTGFLIDPSGDQKKQRQHNSGKTANTPACINFSRESTIKICVNRSTVTLLSLYSCCYGVRKCNSWLYQGTERPNMILCLRAFRRSSLFGSLNFCLACSISSNDTDEHTRKR